MKAALFSAARYDGPAEDVGWPVASTVYSAEAARVSLQMALDQFQMADELGFDWVSVAEHHYAPFSLTPNPMVMAGALTQVVKRAKIALLGASIPINNPVRVAEEFAMLDTITNGRIVAGMLRGTPNEYVTYNVNPAESRARFEEALKLIRMAWTQTEPFGWQGRYYEYRSISLWPRSSQMANSGAGVAQRSKPICWVASPKIVSQCSGGNVSSDTWTKISPDAAPAAMFTPST